VQTHRLLTLIAIVLTLTGCAPKRRSGSGPYVQDIRTDSAVVAIVLRSPNAVRLSFWELGHFDRRTVSDLTIKVNHGLKAVGLKSATRYGYRLETTAGTQLGDGTFRTKPTGAEDPIRFFVIGDSGGTERKHGRAIDKASDIKDKLQGATQNSSQQTQVVAAMRARRVPDFIIHTGDIVYPDGSRDHYREAYFTPFGPLIANVPVYPTLGNHDVKTEGGQPFLETFHYPRNGPKGVDGVYSFDWGCCHLVSLNNVTASTGNAAPQMVWLRADLMASLRKWTVVFIHVPPYSPSRPGAYDYLKKTFVPALDAAGVDLVLCGHDHAYTRFLPRQRATYIVTGGGGKNLYEVKNRNGVGYSESVFHFVEVEATMKEITIRAIDATGNVFDQSKIQKPNRIALEIAARTTNGNLSQEPAPLSARSRARSQVTAPELSGPQDPPQVTAPELSETVLSETAPPEPTPRYLVFAETAPR